MSDRPRRDRPAGVRTSGADTQRAVRTVRTQVSAPVDLGVAALFRTKAEADTFGAAHRGALTRLEYDAAAATVVEADEARRQLADICRTMRERLLRIPSQAAADLAAADNPNQARAVIDRAIGSALADLATIGAAPASAPKPKTKRRRR